MCDYLNIYCFKVEPVSESAHGAGRVTGSRPVPCNGAAGRGAVDALLRSVQQTSATDSSHSRSSSASSSCDVSDSHHVTTRSHARALRHAHVQ